MPIRGIYESGRLGTLAGAFVVAGAGGVLAQVVSPSEVTPTILAPVGPVAVDNRTVPIVQGGKVPEGSEALSLRIGQVDVAGGFPDLADDTAELIRPVANSRVSVADIFNLARAIERAYARRGYVLVRVVVPPQRLAEGQPVRLQVIDGFIERVDVSGVDARVRSVAAGRTQKLVGAGWTTLDDIERAVLLTGSIPGLRVQSALARGEKEGGTVLVLEGDRSPFGTTAGIENGLPSSLGRWQSQSTLSLNSPLGFGEQFYLSLGAGVSRDDSRGSDLPLWMIGGGVVMPLGSDGLTLNPEFVRSSTRPQIAPGTPAVDGIYERYSLRLAAPVIWSRARQLRLTGTLEHIDQISHAPGFSVDLNRDTYSAFRADLDWQDALGPGQVVRANVQYSQGLGGRDRADAQRDGVPLSRQGASPAFSKLAGLGYVSHPVGAGLSFDVTARAQTSFGKPLAVPEQFSLDGTGGVAPFARSTINADSGATIRAELGYAAGVPLWDMPLNLRPYLVAAAGKGWRHDATALEPSRMNTQAFGMGMRFGLSTEQSTNLMQIEFVRRTSDVPRLADENIVGFTLTMRF